MTIKQIDSNVQIRFYIQPNASKTEIVGKHAESIKIRIHATPVDGKANEELIDFLSKILKIKKFEIIILKGSNNRNKIVKLLNQDRNDVEKKINQFMLS